MPAEPRKRVMLLIEDREDGRVDLTWAAEPAPVPEEGETPAERLGHLLYLHAKGATESEDEALEKGLREVRQIKIVIDEMDRRIAAGELRGFDHALVEPLVKAVCEGATAEDLKGITTDGETT